MTSEPGPTQCYVYITLPGQTQAVIAGRFVLTTNRAGTPVGRFVYGKSYLARPEALSIDPVELKLAKRTYETTALKGVFGALRDSGPDYWGRRVIEKQAGRAQLGELDYLLQSPDDRAGALGFGLNQIPPAPRREFNKTLALTKLQALADAIIADEELLEGPEADQVQDLMLIGTSMGGARPKTVVEDEEGLWIAKFNTAQDRWNCARVERAMLVLARNCGLRSAESKVVTVADRDVLLVKRFDREQTENGYFRSRMISGLTLMKAEDTHHARDKWSYVLLAEELRRVCAEPRKHARELFRRMCFNALISNTDDHPRNHAIIARGSDWTLSPAYDLTPTTPVSIERRALALICGDMGRYAHAANLLSQSARFLVERDEAEAIISEMEAHVTNTWYGVARSEGVSEQDCGLIEPAFAYEGFRLVPLGSAIGIKDAWKM